MTDSSETGLNALRQALCEDHPFADLVRSTDWTQTPLGRTESWPQTLVSYAAMVFELPSPAIIFWGPEQTQIYNEGYAVIMGPRHPRYFGAPYRESWPDTYPLIHPWMRRVLDDGEVIHVDEEHITVTRYGFPEEAYFTFTFSPLRDDDGRIAGIFQPVTEVTDKVLGERRAEMLRLLAPHPESRDPVGDVLAAFATNPRDVPLAVLHEWDPEEETLVLAGATPGVSMDGEAAERLTQVARRVYGSAGPAEIELDGLLDPPEGPWPERVHSAMVIPLRQALTDPDEPPMGVATFGVSPRLRLDERYRTFLEAAAAQVAGAIATSREGARMRQAAEREREQLYALFEQAPAAVAILIGPDHVYELANRPYFELIAHRSVLGLPIREALPELEGQGIFEILDRVYETGEPFAGAEIGVTITRHPGAPPEDVYFNFVYQPFRDLYGRIEGIMVFAYDVTEHVMARRALDEARADAESANRAKDQFLAMLGHELRNPLAPILTALEVMRLRDGTSVERERTVIERQANHLVRLVDDLLDVSRVTRGLIELRRERVELGELVGQAIEMASPMIDQRQHELVIDVPSAGMVVDADPARIAQVVSNLLSNAAKYTERGGRIAVEARPDGDEVVLLVRDTGVGIAQEMLPNVFDMFVQERQPLDRSSGGLGLGLAIVRSLVEMHGGRVAARSEGIGRGSEFEVRLPLAPALSEYMPDDEPDTGAAHAVEGRGRRVLLVDDNVDFVDVLAMSLEAAGHETRVAHDGPEALRLAREFGPDVAVVDIGLPAMDGYEVGRRLRSTPGLERLPLVALSGYGQESDRVRSRAAGFDAHLVKPVGIDSVDQLVRRLAAGEAEPV